MGFNTKSYSSMTWMMQGYPRNFGNPHILITRVRVTMGFNTKSYSSMTWMMQGYPRNFGNPHILITRWLLTHVLSMMLTKLMMLPSIYHPFTIHFAVLYLYSYPISPALLTPAGLGHPWRMALMRQPWGQCTLRWLPCKLILWGGCIIGVYHNYIINIYI